MGQSRKRNSKPRGHSSNRKKALPHNRKHKPTRTKTRAKAGSPRLSKAQRRVKEARVRQRRQRFLVVSVIGILLLAGLITGTLLWSRGGEAEPAPDFTVTDSEGQTFTLSQQRGKVVVIDFMAATCSTCVPVTQAMVKAYATHGDKTEFISLDVWSDFETNEDLNNYKAKYGANWTMALDKQAIAQDYGVLTISTLFVVDPGGNLTFRESGVAITSKVIQQAIDEALVGEAKPISQSISLDSFNNLYLWAFVLGLASFFSPCAFPLLPGYISYQLGAEGGTVNHRRLARTAPSKARLRRGLRVGLVTSLGLILLYGTVGVTIGLAGAAVTPYVDYMVPVVALLMIPLGLTMVAGRSFRTGLTQRLMGKGESIQIGGEITPKASDSSYLLYGVGYGAAATGCTAPLLIVLLVAALAAGGIFTAIVAFAIYGGAMGLFMVLVALAVAQSREGLLNKLKGSTVWVKQVSGVILVAVGLWLLYRYLVLL